MLSRDYSSQISFNTQMKRSMASSTFKIDKNMTYLSSKDSSSKMKKIAPVVSIDEVQWLIEMGLGRGVDATKADLWKEKSSFQVQSISKSLENIIGTDEGGAHNYYEREVSSISSRQTELKLSVEEPHSAVQIGVESTFSQSVIKSHKSVGEEVATRTISFRTSFDDLPIEHICKETVKRNSKLVVTKPQQQRALDGEKDPLAVKTDIVKSFEEQLSHWLLDRLFAREDLETSGYGGSSSEDTESSTAKLANLLYNSREETHESVVSDCLLFIKQTGVTHYIHSIQLGAKKFCILSKSEFARKVGVKGTVGMEKLVKPSVSHISTWSNKSSSLNVKEIGKITDGQVKRGAGEEAVISFKVMPIHILITSYHVNIAMKKALRKYIIEKAVKSKGPYLISCGSEKITLYWKIDSSNKVIATQDVESASMFFLSSTDEEDIPEEFMISYYGEDKDVLTKPKGTVDPMSKEEPLAALPRYLDGPVSLFGYNYGPLEVKPNVKEENARFVLHNRVFEGYQPAAYMSWEMGEEFYINCSRRKFRWNGYLAVKKVNFDDFITAIVPSQDKHDGVDTFLLFRLMPIEYKQTIKTTKCES